MALGSLREAGAKSQEPNGGHADSPAQTNVHLSHPPPWRARGGATIDGLSLSPSTATRRIRRMVGMALRAVRTARASHGACVRPMRASFKSHVVERGVVLPSCLSPAARADARPPKFAERSDANGSVSIPRAAAAHHFCSRRAAGSAPPPIFRIESTPATNPPSKSPVLKWGVRSRSRICFARASVRIPVRPLPTSMRIL